MKWRWNPANQSWDQVEGSGHESIKAEEPEIVEVIPDYADTLTAYRTWHVDDYRLHSLNQATDVPWPVSGPYMAKCARSTDTDIITKMLVATGYVDLKDLPKKRQVQPPCGPDDPDRPYDGGHLCGIYTWKNVTEAIKYESNKPFPIVGMVQIGGKVIEHELGYRSQYAMPVCLYILEDFGPDWDSKDIKAFEEMIVRTAGVYTIPVAYLKKKGTEWLPLESL